MFAARLVKAQQILSGFRMESNKDLNVCDNCEHLPNCVPKAITPYTPQCNIVPIPPPTSILEYKNNPKLELLKEKTEEIVVSGNKTIVWARFRREIEDIDAMLKKMKLGHEIGRAHV